MITLTYLVSRAGSEELVGRHLNVVERGGSPRLMVACERVVGATRDGVARGQPLRKNKQLNQDEEINTHPCMFPVRIVTDRSG